MSNAILKQDSKIVAIVVYIIINLGQLLILYFMYNINENSIIKLMGIVIMIILYRTVFIHTVSGSHKWNNYENEFQNIFEIIWYWFNCIICLLMGWCTSD